MRDQFKNIRSALAVSAATWLLATGGIAQAQQVSSAEPGGNVAEAEDGRIADIIVTAQKRSERVNDVPVSVQAIGAISLNNAVATSLSDVALVVPGLNMTRAYAVNSPYIRGIGTTSPLTGVEPAVATYVDGVYLPAAVGNVFAFNNIESIEVLKGPQGTLYGRNATGGVINVRTRDPSHSPAFEFKAGYSNYNTLQLNGYATTGLTDKIAMDIAGYYRNQADGFGRNLTLNQKFQTEREVAIRSKLLIELDPDTQIRIGGDYTHIRTDKGAGLVPIRDGDDAEYTNVSFYDTLARFPSDLVLTSWGVSAELDHQFGSVGMKFINAYRSVDSYFQFPQRLDLANATLVTTDNREKSFTSELQLTSDTSGRFSWILGAFYFRDVSEYKSPNGFRNITTTVAGPVTGVNTISTQKLDSGSIYFDGRYKLTSTTNLTAGIRYTYDARTFVGGRGVTQTLVTVGGVPTIVDNPPVTTRRDSDQVGKLTYRVVLDQKLANDVMLYASFSTGFKSGGFPGNSPTNPVLKPETVNAYEVGLKGTLFDRRLRFALAGFWYDYKNLQVTRVISGAPVSENAAAARIKGIELEGEVAITDGLRFTYGAQYLDAKYLSYPDLRSFVPIAGSLLNANGPIIDAAGLRLRLAPKWTFNAGLSETISLGSSGSINLSANYMYNDGYYFYADNRVFQPAFHILNARAGWTSEDKRFEISLFGKNLANERYFVAAQAGQTNGDFGAYGEPRRYGIELGVKF